MIFFLQFSSKTLNFADNLCSLAFLAQSYDRSNYFEGVFRYIEKPIIEENHMLYVSACHNIKETLILLPILSVRLMSVYS